MNEGDLVYHKTNPSIKMVIESYSDPLNIHCVWITSEGIYYCADFKEFELEPVLIKEAN